MGNPVVVQAANAAIARWNGILQQAGGGIQLVSTNLISKQGYIEFTATGSNLSQSAIMPNGWMGAAYHGYNWWSGQRYVNHFRIQLNSNPAAGATAENEWPLDWSNYTITYSVILHELGHCLGLEHPDWCGMSVVSIMNSRIKDSPHELTSFDINNVLFLYANHSLQATRWAQVDDAQSITNAQNRNARLANLSDSLQNLTLSRLSQAFGWPNVYYYGTGWAPVYATAIDGSP